MKSAKARHLNALPRSAGCELHRKCGRAPFWTRRVSWTDEEGKRHRGPPLGLKAEQQREAALFGSRLRPGELVMLSGVRQRGSRLVIEE